MQPGAAAVAARPWLAGRRGGGQAEEIQRMKEGGDGGRRVWKMTIVVERGVRG